MKTFSRPTTLGLAMLNAACKHLDNPQAPRIATIVGSLIVKDDRPYNRLEHNGIRVSQTTLDSCFK